MKTKKKKLKKTFYKKKKNLERYFIHPWMKKHCCDAKWAGLLSTVKYEQKQVQLSEQIGEGTFDLKSLIENNLIENNLIDLIE
jgi:hypothetical protein